MSRNIEDTLDYQKLIQGQYEIERLPNDFTPEHPVPDYAFNILNSLGLLYRPVVDEVFLAKGGIKPEWPEGKCFAVCLTHDVDVVTLYSLLEVYRARVQALQQAQNWMQRTKISLGFCCDYVETSAYRSQIDPLHYYEKWLEVEATVGARSTFFFWPGWRSVKKHHASDCTYELTDRIKFERQRCTVSEMIREIGHRGWEIGLHPSWYSFNSYDEMKRQKESLEKALRHEIVSVRQHFLHYDIRITPRIHVQTGLKYDSTLGFNDNVGFRFGTCYPYRIYDNQNKEELPIVEVPLIIQDVAMLHPVKGMRLDENTAVKYIKQITEAVRRVGGVLTLLWHTNAVSNPPVWHVYQYILEYLKEKNAWFGSVRDIVDNFNYY